MLLCGRALGYCWYPEAVRPESGVRVGARRDWAAADGEGRRSTAGPSGPGSTQVWSERRARVIARSWEGASSVLLQKGAGGLRLKTAIDVVTVSRLTPTAVGGP